MLTKMKSVRVVLPFLLAALVLTTGTSSTYAWSSAQASVSVFGGTSGDVGYSIEVDSSGNVYTTGYFNGTVDFDPGAGTSNLTSAGGADAFVSKLDSSGNFVWAKGFGGTSGDYGNSIAVDSSGNVYTTGYFPGTVDFDPGAGTSNLTSAGGADAFVSKLDSSGNFVWAKSFGGALNDVGYSIAVDSSGNVYTTGYLQGTGDFDPGAGTSNLTSAGDADAFVSKLDSSGNFVWAKSFGGTSGDYPNSIAVDSSGNVYTTGSIAGTVDFDPGAGTFNLTSAGGADAFVSKLDSSGNFVWAKRFGGTLSDYGQSIEVDSSGNVYTTGYFNGTVDFDPGAGTSNLTSAGTNDVFVSKLDSSGNFVWAKGFGGTSGDVSTSIAVDSSGNVYTTGYFNGTVDFDPGAGTSNLTSAGGADVFVLKLTSSGEVLTVAAPAFTLSASSESRAVNTTATGFTIKSTGGAISSFSINTTPPGMSFNTSTGALTGTPNTVASATNYTITATNASGSATRTFALTVTVAAPAFTLSASSESRAVNTTATGFTINSTGGAIASFSINTTPPGMSFNTSTGALTGTPNTVASATNYTITATNASGSATRTFSLTVTDAHVYVPPMLPIFAPSIAVNNGVITCTIGEYSRAATSVVFSLFVDGKHISTNFSATGDYLPDWIIPWATSATITRTATLTLASWSFQDGYKGKAISCTTLAYSNNATGLISSKVMGSR